MARLNRPRVLVIESQAKAAIPALESLARGGLFVVAASEKRHHSGFWSRYCHEKHVCPSPRTHKAEFQRWLLDFLDRGNIDMLFSLGHYGAPAVSEIQDEVRRRTRFLAPDHATFMAAYAKISTMRTAQQAGVPTPDTWFPHEVPAGIDAVANAISNWPVLIKPDIGVGARGITWCHSPDELRAEFPHIVAAHGPCFVQEFVPSGGMQYKVDMLVDDAQRVLGGIVYGKTRMYPPDGGSSVLNFSADRPDILAFAQRMLAELNWVGFCDFDFVVDPRDDVPKLMEINPRFPESFRMGTSVGIDFPMMIYRVAHGERVEPVIDYPKDRFLRFLPGDVLWFIRVNNQRRFNTWPSWFRFFRHTSYQLLSVRDPGRFLGYLAENVAMLFDADLRRERLRTSSGPNTRERNSRLTSAADPQTTPDGSPHTRVRDPDGCPTKAP
jgi:predicted ATP-grasp superfamily ATP-dependent carboligase